MNRQHQVQVLVSADADRVGQSWPMVPGVPPLVFGRSTERDGVTIADDQLSRKHVSIAISSEGCIRIQDLQSTNGTQVNRVWLQEPLESWSDVLIRAGDTVLHVGAVFPSEGRPNGGRDPLLDHWAREHAGDNEPVGLLAEPGSGVRTFARALHRRSGRTGGLVFLKAGTDVKALACPPGSTVVLLEAHQADPNTLQTLCEQGRHQDLRWVFVAHNTWGGLQAVLTADRRIVLEAPGQRRALLWGLTQHWLGEGLGETVPTFRPSACVAWLSIPLPNGLHSLRERTEALITSLQGAEVVRVAHFQDTPVNGEGGDGRRNMERPSKEALVRLLEEQPSIQAVADHLGRNRRQVYRWMDRYGLRSQQEADD